MTRERAGRWLRVSTGEQDEANQEPDENRWIADHDYEHDPETMTYRLHGKSASKGKQDKELDRVIADMKRGHIRVLVVWHSSRIERRGAYNVFDLARRVKEAGGRIEYVQEPWLNEANEMSDVMLALAATQNKQYITNLKKQVGASFDRIDANGAVRNRVVYGYRADGEKYNKRYVICEPEAEVIREAVRRYLDGETLQAICDDFNARKIPSPMWKGKPGRCWYAKTLSSVLRNKTIAGRYRMAGRTIKVDQIITLAEWRKVDARLSSRAHRRGVPASGNVAMLTSVIYCGKCSGPMYRIRPRQKPCYYCRSGKNCKMLIAEDYLDAEFNEAFELALYGNESITTHRIVPAETHDDEIEQLRLDRAELDDTADDYEEQFLAITRRIKELRESVQPARTETMTLHGRDLANTWHAMPEEQRRQWLLDKDLKFRVFKGADGTLSFENYTPATADAA